LAWEYSRSNAATSTQDDAGSGSFDDKPATVSAGNIAAEIRHLPINNTGGDLFGFGLYTSGVTKESFSMLHVTVTGDTQNYGVYDNSPSPTIRNSSNTGSSLSIDNGDGSTAKVTDTALEGGVFGSGFTCIGVHTSAFAPLNEFCKPEVIVGCRLSVRRHRTWFNTPDTVDWTDGLGEPTGENVATGSPVPYCKHSIASASSRVGFSNAPCDDKETDSSIAATQFNPNTATPATPATPATTRTADTTRRTPIPRP
jgi:hypothetical protein